MFLINDHETETLEFKVPLKQAMRADHDVDRTAADAPHQFGIGGV